ncbi:hypothetical protein TrCOL_g10745 [Triparma columacea]|uniref:Uncharacterized protein n=1 Tax=Triparma columacea TaxID=722753 RepID=A0A9W7FZJ9_9STRA|nr:hypothetical protein TrCOL_g10745 [Triparma columacea]
MSSSVVYTGVENFENNDELTEVTFAKGVTTIGNYAFSRCSSLTAITIPDGVTTIGYCAFYGCSSLAAITIPDGVTSIGGNAFTECSSLAAIKIPDGVTTIDNGAFYRCTALTRLSLSPTVFVGFGCFSGCTALISAAADQNMPTVEDLLHSRWHRILERVTVLSCLKTLLEDQNNPNPNGGEAQTLGVTAVRKRLPKVMWRVILEFL